MEKYSPALLTQDCGYIIAGKNVISWGHSSAGRALRWQRRGQGFDPPWLHQGKIKKWNKT